MSQDPEVGSIAGNAALRAARTYDGRIPLKRWIARCVKIEVWDYWRRCARRREELHSDMWWEKVYESPPHPTVEMDGVDFKLLWEHFVDRVALDVLARRRDVSVRTVRRYIATAKERFLEAMQAETETAR